MTSPCSSSPRAGRPAASSRRSGADMEINGIKFKKGRKVIYCHDLNRIADDPDRRTFVLEPTLRAVEAWMVRLTGIEVETGRDARRGRSAPPPPSPKPSRPTRTTS